jgi:ADP-ribose pyrophosphatase YjhB (NUDIX family)
MKVGTVCFVLDEAGERILLAMKKEGFGEGKWNGFGGKPRLGEDIKAAAVREIREESELIVRPVDLQEAGIVDFYFAGELKYKVFVFLAYDWTGEPAETGEMRPQWFPIDGIPYDGMWDSDRLWLPMVLARGRGHGRIYYDAAGEKTESFFWEAAS